MIKIERQFEPGYASPVRRGISLWLDPEKQRNITLDHLVYEALGDDYDLAGGADALCEQLKKTFYAFNRFLSFLPPGERERMPVRAEFDISPMSGLIPEGNADPVRGHCANSRWPSFCANTGEWVEDALAYYSWKSRPE